MIGICARNIAAHIMKLWKYKPLDPEVGLSIKAGDVAGGQGGEGR
jgi:hypothetical protein